MAGHHEEDQQIQRSLHQEGPIARGALNEAVLLQQFNLQQFPGLERREEREAQRDRRAHVQVEQRHVGVGTAQQNVPPQRPEHPVPRSAPPPPPTSHARLTWLSVGASSRQRKVRAMYPALAASMSTLKPTTSAERRRSDDEGFEACPVRSFTAASRRPPRRVVRRRVRTTTTRRSGRPA